jgi:hypothetical protein
VLISVSDVEVLEKDFFSLEPESTLFEKVTQNPMVQKHVLTTLNLRFHV